MRHEESVAIAAPGHSPRGRGAGVYGVEQHGVEELQFREVNDAPGVAVDPATLDLGRRQVKVRQDVRHDGVAAVRRDTDVSQQRAPARQKNFLEHLSRCEINDAHARRDDIDIRPAGVNVVGHQEPPSVRRDRRRKRLPLYRDSPHFLPCCEVNDADVVVEAVADVERTAVGTQHRRLCLITGVEMVGHPATRRVHYAHGARRATACDIELGPVRRDRQPRRRTGDGNARGDLLRGRFEYEHLARGLTRHVKSVPIGSGGDGCGREEDVLLRRCVTHQIDRLVGVGGPQHEGRGEKHGSEPTSPPPQALDAGSGAQIAVLLVICT